MAKDTRTSKEPVSGYAVWASGDSATSNDVATIRDEATISPEGILISYSDAGTTEATVELYDDEEGTSEANLSGQFGEVHVSPGENLTLSDVVRGDISDDVVGVVRGNDADISVSFGGHVISG